MKSQTTRKEESMAGECCQHDHKNSQAKSLPVDGKTVPEAYLRRIEVTPQKIYYRTKIEGQYQPVTWNEFHESVLRIFEHQERLGIKKGDRICIFSQSCPEWIMVDLATQARGAITVPIYHSNTAEDVAYILGHAKPSLIYIDDSTCVQKLAEAFGNNEKLPTVICFNDLEKVAGIKLLFLSDIVKSSLANDIQKKFKESALKITSDDAASIVYTSGTTGTPKGVILTQENFASEFRSLTAEMDLKTDDETLTFLPFAHIMGRVECLIPVFCGFILNFAENINSVAQDIEQVRPTLLVSVPRIYEKVYSKIISGVQSSSKIKQALFNWAIGVGREVAKLRAEKATIPPVLFIKNQIADALVFSKIRAKLGGRIRMTLSGGAPLSAELCQIFHACGIMIMEAYGLTETTAAITVNKPYDYCFTTVGKPLGKTELRIAEDGEILVRGPMVFKDYYNNPKATAEVFTKDGWFCTGDVGEINDRGFLRITDRKKEIIVTSGGKNIAPQKLENLLKTNHYISNVMVIGDQRKYITALITLNEQEVRQFALQNQIMFESYSDLIRDEKVVALVNAQVKKVNEHLASYESIKHFAILHADFTTETGELTPSLKVKRKVISTKYKEVIESLYS